MNKENNNKPKRNKNESSTRTLRSKCNWSSYLKRNSRQSGKSISDEDIVRMVEPGDEKETEQE